MPDQDTSNQAEIEQKFWKALRSDMTVMLGLDGVDDGHTRPMTAQIDGDADRGPLYFFGSKESELVAELSPDGRAIATFVSKGNDVFATIHGTLSADNDRAVIDRLWNPHVAAWYEQGKDDPKLQLLRLDTESAKVWIDSSSLLAGVKVLLGIDPKQDAKDKVAEVSLA